MTGYIILCLDIKAFSLLRGTEQNQIKKKLDNLTTDFFKNKFGVLIMPTGDGFYIGMKSSDRANNKILDYIAHLFDELEDVEIRYALNFGYPEINRDINNFKVMAGEELNDSRRILDSISSGNVVLASEEYYRRFIGNGLVKFKQISDNSEIETLAQVYIKDKHGKSHSVYNIKYIKDEIEYGFRYFHQTSETKNIEDSAKQKDYFTLLSGSFPNRKIINIKSEDDSKKNIIYDFFKVDVSNFSSEYFLFLNKNISKVATIEHFLENNEIDRPVTICANKKYLDKERNLFWQKDFLDKFFKIGKKFFLKKEQHIFWYLDDYIWENCIKDHRIKDIDDESNYVNPLADIDESIKKLHETIDVIASLQSWVDLGDSPILILLGQGGIGKTTVIKKFVNKINNSEVKKLAIYIDASLISNRIKQDINFSAKIDTIFDLLKLYFSSIDFNFGFPFIRNQDFLNLIISSGNIIIVIDGIDEIAASLKENFSTQEFINNILKLNGLLNHSKIILASRSYFWESELSKTQHQMYEKLILKGFNLDLAERYFEKKLEKNDDLIKEAIQILKSFTKKTQGEYSPFIVYLVSDIVKKKEADISGIIFDSKYLDFQDTFDTIIAHVCERERLRQHLKLDLDDFIDLFSEIVFVHQNQMPLPSFEEYLSIILENKVKFYKPLLSNPFLSLNNNIVSISHNFLEHHFIVIYLSFCLNNNFSNDAVYKVLSRYYDGKTDTLIDLIKRIDKTDGVEVEFEKFFSNTLNKIRDEKDSKIDIYYKRRSVLCYIYQ